jgi:hypothetical protein
MRDLLKAIQRVKVIVKKDKMYCLDVDVKDLKKLKEFDINYLQL